MDLQTWQSALLTQLDDSGPEGQAASRFIRERRIKVGFRQASPAVGAFWYIDGNIYLSKARYSVESPVTKSAPPLWWFMRFQHLRQGILTALSVYGELEAWQLDFGLYHRLTGSRPGPPLSKLLALPLSFDRGVLSSARQLMQEFAGRGYRIDLLPLYPLGKEIAWWITRTTAG